MDDLAGIFWRPHLEHEKSSGILTGSSDGFEIKLDAFIEQPEQVQISRSNGTTTTTFSGSADEVVRDFSPRVIWGEVRGTPVTFFDAMMQIDFRGWEMVQVYGGRRVLWGSHLHNEDVLVEQAKFLLPVRSPGWMDDPAENGAFGVVESWKKGRASGLCIQLDTPIKLSDMTRTFTEISTVLLQLWTGRPMKVTNLQIRISGSGWLDWGTQQENEPVPSGRSEFPLHQLRLKHLVRWMELAPTFGPLPYIAARSVGVLQADATVAATALEGLHRRLHGPGQRFAGVSGKAIKRAVNEASAVGARSLADEGWGNEAVAGETFRGALSHVNELGFRDRLRELAEPITEIAPGLLGPDPDDWTQLVMRVRNAESHQLLATNGFGESDISDYYVVAASARSVLRLSLLMQITEPELLKGFLRNSEPFQLLLANIDREGIWPGFSSLDTFLRTKR